jgi:alpha-amylase
MNSICFYFQVHQPYRLKNYKIFDIGKNHDYFDDALNKKIMQKVARKCYLPTNNLMLNLIHKYKDKFKISYSITGTALEQFKKYAPDVLKSFVALAKTGNVEFLSETYYHSLSFLYSKPEFVEQVNKHKNEIKKLFGQTPKIFRNTELIFNNELAHHVENMGYQGILAEGVDRVLDWRSPNYVYKAKTTDKLKLLLKNYKLSDDIAFRFSNKGWNEWPLTTTKFAKWVKGNKGHSLNLFMDYETFGEHQWEDTGIFNFMKLLPEELFKDNITFKTPSQIINNHDPVDELDIHEPVSWADMERDLSAWLGNNIQKTAIKELFELESDIKATKDKKLIEDWRKLSTSDHFYYMCTKYFSDGDVHKYFNPYDTPYDSYVAFMNILNDMVVRINNKKSNIQTKFRISENPKLLINNPIGKKREDY